MAVIDETKHSVLSVAIRSRRCPLTGPKLPLVEIKLNCLLVTAVATGRRKPKTRLPVQRKKPRKCRLAGLAASVYPRISIFSIADGV
jgi:hypothetical protein